MKTLHDSSPMPWGDYRGVQMQHLPTHYLREHWFRGQSDYRQSSVAEYIRRNLSRLGLREERP